jgi:predicted small secreted protein
MKKLIYTLLLGTALMAFASGCRTAHGFGEDMEKAGDKIQDGTR